MRFRHFVLDPEPPGSLHDILLLSDLTGNGRPDVIVGGKQGEPALFWYENTGTMQAPWPRHELGSAEGLEAGGVLVDVNGDGRLDLVAGQGSGGCELYWFEQPADPRQRWRRHLIDDRFDKYHDQIVGDVDGDGEDELVVFSQRAGVLGYYDLPPEPAAGPWQDHFQMIADDVPDHEGLALADLDNSGRLSIVAGPIIYRRCCCSGGWHPEPVAPGMRMTRAAAADLNGDGWPDLVFCEGESDPGTLLWFQAPRWRPHLLASALDHPHSLQVADFTGDGQPDIMVGEMGLGTQHPPRLVVYVNRGGGEFEPVVVAEGIPLHEAKVADLTGNGRPDIVSKAYQEGRVDVWVNES